MRISCNRGCRSLQYHCYLDSDHHKVWVAAYRNWVDLYRTALGLALTVRGYLFGAEEVKELVPNESNAYRLNTQYLVACLHSAIQKIDTEIDKDTAERNEQIEFREFKAMLEIYQHQQMCWWENMDAFMKSKDIDPRGVSSLDYCDGGDDDGSIDDV